MISLAIDYRLDAAARQPTHFHYFCFLMPLSRAVACFIRRLLFFFTLPLRARRHAAHFGCLYHFSSALKSRRRRCRRQQRHIAAERERWAHGFMGTFRDWCRRFGIFHACFRALCWARRHIFGFKICFQRLQHDFVITTTPFPLFLYHAWNPPHVSRLLGRAAIF